MLKICCQSNLNITISYLATPLTCEPEVVLKETACATELMSAVNNLSLHSKQVTEIKAKIKR